MKKLLKYSIIFIMILFILVINTNILKVFATQEYNIANEHIADKSTVDDYKKIITDYKQGR